MLFIFKRFVQDSVTRTCNACNTNVKLAQHVRVTSVTRTCNGKCDKKFRNKKEIATEIDIDRR